ncbi:uncharacterized protein LOC116175478 [Photinus pyralis]|uniref:uncharacterized protein LOC116175478 n=1 Tax=Photinus pyralis TaxID=7054 RepID=UPI0012671142|nr:uncharacterized protein LOC116175478 [Photinus pyralis]
MKVLIVVALSLVAVANCRPDVSHLIPTGSYLPVAPPSGNYLPSDSPYGSDKDEKHVYFYGSDEDHYVRFKVNVVPASHKNTKIIFVKAPGFGIVPEVVAPPSQAEDKTLVYVLVKKPQDGSISIPTGLGVKQEKPQVFFIKYNSKQDAASQVSAGAQGQQVGHSVPDLGSESAFVGTLGNGAQANGHSGGGYPSGGPSNGQTEVNILPDDNHSGPY